MLNFISFRFILNHISHFRIFQKLRQSFSLPPLLLPLPSLDTLLRTQNDSRGTDSEIELRVSLKNPYRSPFMVWRSTRPGDFEPGGLARSRHSSRSLNYSTHSRARHVEIRAHLPLRENTTLDWRNNGIRRGCPATLRTPRRIYRENKRRSTSSMRCEASIVSKRWKIEGLQRCINR